MSEMGTEMNRAHWICHPYMAQLAVVALMNGWCAGLCLVAGDWLCALIIWLNWEIALGFLDRDARQREI